MPSNCSKLGKREGNTDKYTEDETVARTQIYKEQMYICVYIYVSMYTHTYKGTKHTTYI